MHDLLEKILGTAILLILRYSGTLGESRSAYSLANATNGRNFVSPQNVKIDHSLDNHKVASQLAIENTTIVLQSDNSVENKSGEPRSYYSSVSATPFIPAFDPISVLASLAFLAFLIQSFAALFDRTRSIIPTIINSRQQSSFEYNDQFADMKKGILRALEEYASLSNDLLNNDNESKTYVS